jgi:hypothetical protein
MKRRDPMYTYAPLNDEDGARYLGNREQIEKVLGFCNMTEVSKKTREQISLQPQQQVDSFLEQTK